MKAGKTLQQMAAELERQNNVKRDFISDTSKIRMAIDGREPNLDIVRADGAHTNIDRFSLNDIAHRQIGTHLNIPAKYYDRMRTEYPDLLTANVNAWLHKQPTRRMVRTLDGTARAFLSDRYRRIDNHEIAMAVLPIIGEMKGARIESSELTDSRMYLKVVNPRLEAEVRKGDIVQAGILISNSEVGHGSVSVQPLVFRLVCLNGMVVNDLGQRRYHVGRQNTTDDYELFRDETLQSDDRAFMLKIQDTVRAAVDEAKFKLVVDKMKEATEAEISGRLQDVVELSAKKWSLNQGESDNVLQHLIKGGDLSLFGLSSAVTRAAQDVESYDRSTEMESLGWNILNVSRREWDDLNKGGEGA
ncbi:DUF932 domain-containing protein [Paenibacillus hemerocallicola]|uniref:DUF932 domain-containing protein n=1 Tax=Paenibacillus hemerocallicola TaxID=1172614 RepID=A0A5C4TGD9_9BACL|nr:DUF932 domain-containing protein [Paenibacillus hemerocallicola]TNJ68194.1 DUF932 domain-containing protein [Paenibacillus hemerocallicola]